MSLLRRGLDVLFGKRAEPSPPPPPRVEPGLNLPPARQLDARLVRCETIARDTKLLVFEPVGSPLFPWIAGQHATLIFEEDHRLGVRRETRIYSLWNDPEGATDAQIVLKLMPTGRASDLFRDDPVGLVMPMVGPQGSFALRPRLPSTVVLVGTGTGYSPLRTMLLQLARQGGFAGRTVRLVWGLRQAADVFALDELAALVAEHPSLEVTVALTGEPTLPTGWPGAVVRGRVTDVLAPMALDPRTSQVYLCGNGQMILDACARLEAKGIRRDTGQIVYEKFFDAPFGGIARTPLQGL